MTLKQKKSAYSFTYLQLAKKLMVDEKTICRIINGKQKPGARLLRDILKLLK
jgi:transcriptional regulator with XRE-family HTH domain